MWPGGICVNTGKEATACQASKVPCGESSSRIWPTSLTNPTAISTLSSVGSVITGGAKRGERSHGLLPTLTSSSFYVPSKRTVSTCNAKISWLTWWFTRCAMNLASATAVTLSRRCERRVGHVKELLKQREKSKLSGPHTPCTRA